MARKRQYSVEQLISLLNKLEEGSFNSQKLANLTGISYPTVNRYIHAWKNPEEAKVPERIKDVVFIWKNFQKTRETIIKNIINIPNWMRIKEILEFSRIINHLEEKKIPITYKNIYDQWKNVNSKITYQRVKDAYQHLENIMKASFFMDENKFFQETVFSKVNENFEKSKESKKDKKEQKEIKEIKEIIEKSKTITITFKTKNFDIQVLKDIEDLLDIEIISFKKEQK